MFRDALENLVGFHVWLLNKILELINQSKYHPRVVEILPRRFKISISIPYVASEYKHSRNLQKYWNFDSNNSNAKRNYRKFPFDSVLDHRKPATIEALNRVGAQIQIK